MNDGKRKLLSMLVKIEADHSCPRCHQVALSVVQVGGVQFEQCPTCAGIWIDAVTFQRICTQQQAQESALTVDLPAPGSLDYAVRYLKCPRCSTPMSRQNFGPASGVIIDRCAPHGCWFDRDELRRIIDFIRAGGLRFNQDGRQNDLQRARRQLEASRGSNAMSASLASAVDRDVGFLVAAVEAIGLLLM